jgi:hypothetical protein
LSFAAEDFCSGSTLAGIVFAWIRQKFGGKSEQEFVNFEGAQESIPRNQFRQPM